VPGGEGGLLGLALLDDQLYAYITNQVDGRTENAVVRMTLTGDAGSGFRLGAPEAVLSGIPGAGTHNGGRLAFGPDEMLYVTTGDARNTDNSQDPSSLGGKILRITPDGEPAPGNPDPASPVWTLGHRNVQGIGWDAQGRMFASEFGQNRLDELNLIEPGNNYGWPHVEGGGGAPEYTDPLVTWATSESSPSDLAVTGDAVYLAALRGQRLWRVPLATGSGSEVVGPPEPYFVGEFGRLRDILVEDGSLLVLTNNTRGQDNQDQLLRVSLR
jgi:glucose/arabinose dehydrogenase